MGFDMNLSGTKLAVCKVKTFITSSVHTYALIKVKSCTLDITCTFDCSLAVMQSQQKESTLLIHALHKHIHNIILTSYIKSNSFYSHIVINFTVVSHVLVNNFTAFTKF